MCIEFSPYSNMCTARGEIVGKIKCAGKGDTVRVYRYITISNTIAPFKCIESRREVG